ncbi:MULTISPECIES: hypothetical protein [Arthrobacter]|uniref:LGFP repeat-containing protein n=2 Tax=Arthrobacter TaxID=1663 RepID=A0ABU9KMB4_9MICC|nr:hypothetical protein [Arthrobacter sp. YJM1]MDP5227098.1 hypothetical protein [Arthrobacter sp. YJM1]
MNTTAVTSPAAMPTTAADVTGSPKPPTAATTPAAPATTAVAQSPATASAVPVGSAFTAWYGINGNSGTFGEPIADQVCPSAGFCTQDFQNGTAYWKPSLGAHGVLKTSDPGAKYFADGGYATYGMPDGEIGWFLADDAFNVPESHQQSFEKAIIVVPSGSPAFTLDHSQPIVKQFQPVGSYGFVQWLGPVTCGLPQGACSADFLGIFTSAMPRSIVRTYSLGTSTLGSIAVNGPEWNRWKSLGGEAGWAGYPLKTNCQFYNAPGYCETKFQQAAIYSTAQKTVLVKGAMLRWDGDVWNLGLYGVPLADEQCGLTQGGCRQEFSGGTIMWTPATNSQPVKGGIRTKWKAMGGEAGRLGYPTGPEQCFGWSSSTWDQSGCYQWFQGGIIWWSPATGAHAVWGAIMGAYQRANWVWFDRYSVTYAGQSLGYPISEENCSGPGGGCYQWFQYGIIWWSPTTGAQRVMNGDMKVYESLNWAWGRLGYPTSEEQSWLPSTVYPYNVWGTRQYFQRGYLTWHPRYGITVTYY